MKRILFCDDDHNIRETISGYLSWYGFQVDGMNQTHEVLSRVHSMPYDLLICNAWQKMWDGFDLCDSFRKNPEGRLHDLPILIVAPEPFDLEDFKFLRHSHIYFMPKYKGPERWYEKITTILKL